MKKKIILGLLFLPLAACSTLSFDKDRAAEQRKQELCRDIGTKDLPQCTGQYTPDIPVQ